MIIEIGFCSCSEAITFESHTYKGLQRMSAFLTSIQMLVTQG